jgi:hypothetical protein
VINSKNLTICFELCFKREDFEWLPFPLCFWYIVHWRNLELRRASWNVREFGMKIKKCRISILHIYCEYMCVKLVFGSTKFELIFVVYILVCRMYWMEVQFSYVIVLFSKKKIVLTRTFPCYSSFWFFLVLSFKKQFKSCVKLQVPSLTTKG